jgi:hypothetical protein
MYAIMIGSRLRSNSLDRAIAAGQDPARSVRLAARAEQLQTRTVRARLADALDRLARSDRERSTRRRVLPSRAAVRANSQELHALAALLRGSSPVCARGVAMLRGLVTDGTGPVYNDRDGDILAAQLSRARAAVSG